MERKALLTLTLGVILFFAHPAHAQFIGDRMRITAEHGEEILGRMKGYDAYSLTILTDSTELSIAYADMVRLQRSLGVRGYSIEGIVIGLAARALVSIFAVSREGNIEEMGCAPCADIASGIVAGFDRGVMTSGGALIGLIVGAVIRTEKWERLDIPGQGAASITPIIGVHPTGRLALGARISF